MGEGRDDADLGELVAIVKHLVRIQTATAAQTQLVMRTLLDRNLVSQEDCREWTRLGATIEDESVRLVLLLERLLGTKSS